MNRPVHSVIQYAGLMKFSILLWKKALKRLEFLTQKINSIDGLFFSKRLNSQSLVLTFAYWLANFPEHFDLLIRFAVFSVTGSMTHVLFSPPRVWELVKIPFYNKSLIVKALWIIVPTAAIFFFLEYTQLIFGLEAESYFRAYIRSLHCSSTPICLSTVHLLSLIVACCGNMSIKMFLSIAVSTNTPVYMLILYPSTIFQYYLWYC